MKPTICLNDDIVNAILQETYLVLYHPLAFHTANGVFNTDSDRRDRTMSRFLRWSEFTPTWFWLRLDDGETLEDKPLEAHILVKATAVRQGIAVQIRRAFIIRLPFVHGTQEADVTGLINNEEVLDRVALLLA